MPFKLKSLDARDPDQHHRPATPLELFFDLVSVIAIAAITESFHHAISHGHGLEMLPNFLFLFAAVWWAWINFTWFASAFDNDDALYRVTTIVIMSGALLFAAGASYIFENFDFSYGILGWVIMRIGMIIHWARVAIGVPKLHKTAMRYIIGLVIAQCIWVAGYLVFDTPTTIFLFCGVAFIIELCVPMFAEKAGATPFHREHIVERYGLLNIIVLGEGLLSAAYTFSKIYESHFEWGLVSVAVSGIIIIFILWWLYFIDEEHLSKISFKHVFQWGYMHALIFAGGAATGAAIAVFAEVAAHKSHLAPESAIFFLGVPMAVYMLTLWFIRDRHHALGSRQLALPVMSLVIIGACFVTATPMVLAALLVLCLIWRMPFNTKTA